MLNNHLLDIIKKRRNTARKAYKKYRNLSEKEKESGNMVLKGIKISM